MAQDVAVAYEAPRHREEAGRLARVLSLPLAKKFGDPRGLHLVVADHPDHPAEQNGAGRGGQTDMGQTRLELRVLAPGHPLAGGHGVFADLLQLDTTSPAGRSLKTPLMRAVGVHQNRAGPRPHVLDATAGLGEDCWLLAAAGCRVTAIERQPIIHALLADGLSRAGLALPDVAARITLLDCVDAADFLRAGAPGQTIPGAGVELPGAGAEVELPGAGAEAGAGVEVVLIDPMFPGHGQRKTTERKPMRVLRLLAGDDADADALLDLALGVATRRVVVKRPRRAPHLADRKPTVSHAGRGLRFDVYPVAAHPTKSGA